MAMNLPNIIQFTSTGATSVTVPSTSIPFGKIIRVSIDGVNVPFRWSGASNMSLANTPRVGAQVNVFLDDMINTDVITAAGTLDFPSVAIGGVADLTLTVPTGAISTSWAAIAAITTAAVPTGLLFSSWVSSTAAVTVRAYNPTAAAIDPAPITVRVSVMPA